MAPPFSAPSMEALYEVGSLVPFHKSSSSNAKNSSNASGGNVSKSEVLLHEVYELDEKPLGKGSYGEVWRATHRLTGARRAIKTVSKHQYQKQSVSALFARREFEILRQLDHPNIVRLYEAFEDAESLHFVLELLEGGDLLGRVANPAEHVPEKEAAALLQQMLSAIQHLHVHGVVHRDVKPENFLFTRKEPKHEPSTLLKLIDFGLSRRLSYHTGATLSPKIGTMEYMAPEAHNVVPEMHADRLDMWSLGVVLHTMLTGHFPSARLAKEPPEKYFQAPYWNQFSRNAKDILTRLLHFQASERINTAVALRHPFLPVLEDDQDMVSGIPDAIRSYAVLPGLRRLVLVAAAREVDDRDLIDVRQIFQKLVLECDGAITRLSLECVACMAGTVGAVAAGLMDCFAAIDTDGSGTIDWTELVAAALCTSGALVRTNIDGDSNFEGATGNAEADGEDACWRAFDLLRHGNGAVSCEAPLAYAHASQSANGKKLARQWYLM